MNELEEIVNLKCYSSCVLGLGQGQEYLLWFVHKKLMYVYT